MKSRRPGLFENEPFNRGPELSTLRGLSER
jgi:hypothetical protein